MGLLDKVKDFFYDEEEIEEVVPVRKKEKTTKEEAKPEKKFNIYDIEKETTKEKEKEIIHHKPKVKKVVEPEVNERELFRAERTFNFPVDLDETREFKQATVEIPVVSEPRVEERQNVRRSVAPSPRYNTYNSYSTPYSPYKKENKRFKPTPVISPIYGVLNENYKKEDIVDTGKSRIIMENGLSSAPTEFDKIRQKAYKKLDEELERTFNDTPKDIFFNMDEEEKKIENEVTKESEIEENIKNDYEEEPYKKDEVVITYGEIDEEEDITPDVSVAEEIDIKEEGEDDIEVPTIPRRKKVEEPEEDNDVFKIIDNMYNDEEDEEGEE